MNMQKYNQDNPTLVNSIVCAIDILGFSQMIVESSKDGSGNTLLRHKRKIEELLALHKNNIRVWDKYVWTANYHNCFCDLYFPEEKNLKISRKILLSWPRQIAQGDF